MPRPCQKRRESAAANKRSKPNPKPAGPSPIRHKARQKAIHNARRGRGRGGGRGGARGGRPSRNQGSGDGIPANQDFISFGSAGNNFNVLNGAGSRHDPIDIDGDFLEDGEVTDSTSDSEGDYDDSDVQETGALTINVQVQQGYGARPPRAVVMFPIRQALDIYRRLHKANFPLVRPTTLRYGLYEEVTTAGIAPFQPATTVGRPHTSSMPVRSATIQHTIPPTNPSQVNYSYPRSSSNTSPASAPMSRQPSTSTATSGSSMGARATILGREYMFDFGVHVNRPFTDVPEQYLRTIAGNPILIDKHPGLKEAYDYHRPGMRRIAPTERQRAKLVQPPVQPPVQEPVQAPSRGTRNQGTRGPARGTANRGRGRGRGRRT